VIAKSSCKKKKTPSTKEHSASDLEDQWITVEKEEENESDIEKK